MKKEVNLSEKRITQNISDKLKNSHINIINLKNNIIFGVFVGTRTHENHIIF